MSTDKIPDSYYVGQEYVDDPNKIDVLIKFKFRPATVFSNIDFNYSKLQFRQLPGGEVLCTLSKKISLKLFIVISQRKDVHLLFRATSYIIGYIKLYLPLINEQIQKQKYLDGHILARTISLNDLYDILVVKQAVDEGGLVDWPMAIMAFPASNLTTAQDAVFIRDLIDAMTAYFQYNLDDCIRKIITSLENCFSYYQLIIPSKSLWGRLVALLKGRRIKIQKLVKEYIQEGKSPYIERDLAILRRNILFIYRLRNMVVHDKLRINPRQTTICRKGIGTLLYLYQGSFLSVEHRSYIFDLYSQFISIYEQQSGYSLEIAEWRERTKDKNKKSNIINTPDDMNRWMFENLRITKQEIKDTLSGKLEEHLPPNERV